MKPGIDIDNCVLNSATLMVEEFNKLFKTSKFRLEDITTYSFMKCLNVTDSVEDLVVSTITSLDEIPPLPGAENVLRWLQTLCSPLTFISDRPTAYYDVTRKQLKHLGLDSHYTSIILTGQKMPHDVRYDKAFWVNRLGLDVFIEDKPAHILALHEKTECEILLFDRPWNREIELPKSGRINVMRDWVEIRDWFMVRLKGGE